MTYYQVIDGVRYDRQMLDLAKRLTVNDGLITLEEIKSVFQAALDGGRITQVERRTLAHIRTNFPLDQAAMTWLDAQSQEPSDLEATIRRVLVQDYGLDGIQWQIDAEEVQKQVALRPGFTFEDALHTAVRVLIEGGRNQLSLEPIALNANPSESAEQIRKHINGYLKTGLLTLIPVDPAAPTSFELPSFSVNREVFWVFGFETPALPFLRVLGLVLRNNVADGHSEGYLSPSGPVEAVTEKVLRFYLQLPEVTWDIDPAEVAAQFQALPARSFGDALFSAFNSGIYNAESSFSFNDSIRHEIWLDPARQLWEFEKAYIRKAHIVLFPVNFRERIAAGTFDFDLPQAWTPDFSYGWYFGVKMDSVTDIRVLVNVNREGELDAAWNDSFHYTAYGDFDTRTQKVVNTEFGLEGLEVKTSETEYLQQATQFGPDWVPFHSLLRQALRTVIEDYLTAQSVFYLTSQTNGIQRDQFDSDQAFRGAVSDKVRSYLSSGRLFFLPTVIDGSNPDLQEPANGETAETFWRFLLYLPELSDHAFFVLAPRYEETDDSRSYNYGVN